jgi:PAS domain S-box-containing protein
VPKRSLITIDKKGTIISVNQAARDLFGYAVGTLVRQNVRVLMPEPHSSRHQEYVDRYLTSGKSSGAIGAWKGGSCAYRCLFLWLTL